jgi:hypothetical protein
VSVGYTVQLLAGEVRILAERFSTAVELLKRLDRERDDLKGGGFRPHPHAKVVRTWSFISDDLQEIESFPDMLLALRFEPLLDPDGDLIEVLLAGGHRSRGDELHFWSALAPIIEPGSRMDWFGEDDAVWRWRFDGSKLVVVPGTLTFEE